MKRASCGKTTAGKEAVPPSKSGGNPPEADMQESAAAAAAFLKTLAHEGRLMILCHLIAGEKSVSELENLMNLRQAAVSQMLARLREEGLVTPRREGKAVYYSLNNGSTEEMIALLHKQFCG
ncbi:metalloregulator ArsR/SmtB family transcription factor [Leisingera sp. JC11]|uniref:ArsR/SmtB family transcription factor n=1 Tax=Leisingera sp. JC11 TaxID=3042469 RepID=UPI003456E3F1